ncbi:MAG: ATP-grasp domain-containing protein [Byssovorax sp.]
MAANLNILCMGSFNTGDRFLERAVERGCRVWALTKEKHLGKPWRRDLLQDLLAMPNDATMQQTLNAVCYLNRTVKFDRIIPFDDLEVETTSTLREHLRVPGMGDTTARVFRDKLAMRVLAREMNIPVPEFTGVLHYPDIEAFTRRVEPPYMLKPRQEAASAGIKKITSVDQLWQEIHALGDMQSYCLIEKYIPGDVYHVDAIVSEGEIKLMECHKTGIPPFDVSHGGGVFSTMTVERGSDDDQKLRATASAVLKSFKLLRGTAHVEFIKGQDGVVYFLEIGARVGGGHIAELVEISTGVNLWREWADIEIDKGQVPYALPERRFDYAGLVQCLARAEHPDLSAYSDPEVTYHTHDRFHAGLIVRSPDHARVESLVASYRDRFAQDFVAVMPLFELPLRRA